MAKVSSLNRFKTHFLAATAMEKVPFVWVSRKFRPFLICRLLCTSAKLLNKMDVCQYRRLAEQRRCHVFIVLMFWRTLMVNRDIWVHPLNLKRQEKGEFYTLYLDLHNFRKEFFSMYRMYPAKFDSLLRLLEPILKGTVTNMRKLISAEQKLVLTLRKL